MTVIRQFRQVACFWIVILTLVSCAASPEPAVQQNAESVVPWHEAQEHIGEVITVEGTIVRAHNTGQVCFLNFSQNWRDEFYLIIFRQNLGAWSRPPEQHFMNRTIRCTGLVEEHEGRPQIKILDPAQIQIVR